MADRPNILLIMDDQHRYDWLGCSGATWVDTPNIDALAARGMNLTHCCTNSPVCVAARVSLATGLLPRRTGMVDNNGYLSPAHDAYYARLRYAGYRVGCVGKLHMRVVTGAKGRSVRGNDAICYEWGFTHPEEHEGKCEAGLAKQVIGPYTDYLNEKGLLDTFREDYLKRQKQGWPFASHDAILDTQDFQDYWTGTRAVNWLEDVEDNQPWHLFVSFGGPHDPFDPPKEYADKYRDREMPEPIAGNDEGKPEYVSQVAGKYEREFAADPQMAIRSRQQYAALIELVDDQVGRFVDVLNKRNMLENTVILFVSDHGELLGDHGLWRKRFFYESSLRVPLVAAGPGVAQGETSDALIEMSDINATICEIAGLPAQPLIDSQSFVPLLTGQTTEHRDYVVSQIDNRDCLRTKTHKVIRTPNQTPELYDLVNDPDEQRNVMQEQSDVAQELFQLMVTRHKSLHGETLG